MGGGGRQLDLFGAPASAVPPRRRHGVGPAPVDDDLIALAEAVPAGIRLGTSSWSFPGWVGLVYDREASETTLARDGIGAYAAHPLFRTVGLDRTFYAPMSAAAMAALAAAVPHGFRFLVKANERCTLRRFSDHPRYGAHRGTMNPTFLDPAYATDVVVRPCLDGLRDATGPILFQFPPQDVRAAGGPDRLIERLHGFLAALPRGPLYAVEIRNPELLTPRYAEALAATGAAHCYNVHPSMPSVAAQTRTVPLATQPAFVARWLLQDGLRYEEAKARYAPFDQLVDPDPIARGDLTVGCGEAVAHRRRAYVIVNNKAEGSSPRSVVELARALVAACRSDGQSAG